MARDDLPTLSEWQVMLLRLTAFPAPDFVAGEQNWWEELAGELPEKQTTQPKTGAITEEGEYSNGVLVLNMLPTRINWLYAAPDQQIVITQKLPILGQVEDEIKSFIEIMNSWLVQSSPHLIRLAFGARMIIPTDGREKAYTTLSQFLPFELDIENSSDFLYRINKRRPSKSGFSSLEINRLSTWSALRFQMGGLKNTQVSEQFACQLEVDINTIPDFDGTFDNDTLPDLFHELVELGLEIAEKGDIP